MCTRKCEIPMQGDGPRKTKTPIHRQKPQNIEATDRNDILPTFLNWLVLVPLVRGRTPISLLLCVGGYQEEPENHKNTKTTEKGNDRIQGKYQKTKHMNREKGRG